MSTQPPPAIIAAARSAQMRTGIPASVLLAQWALESGWGKHMPGGSNNPFGEKALPGDPSVAAPTSEVVNGHLVPTNAPFRAFLSIEAAFDFHATHLATSRHYIAARSRLPDVDGFCHALSGVYATDPDYGDKLIAVIEGSNLTQYDTPAQESAA